MLAGLILKKREFKLPYGQELIKSYFHRSSFGADEIFLSQHVYPYAKKQGYIRNQRAKFLEFDIVGTQKVGLMLVHVLPLSRV